MPNFLAAKASQGVLNKDPTIWLKEPDLPNTCIPLSFPGYTPAQLHDIPTPKNTFTITKKLAKIE
jgi:hypothetical protein